jgi:hypothetical protein
MNESKTYEEWINLLPEPYKTQAWTNIKNQMWSEWDPLKVTYNPAMAISDAFDWFESPEEGRYWSDLFQAFGRHEKYVNNNPNFPPNLIYLGAMDDFDPTIWLKPGDMFNTYKGWMKHRDYLWKPGTAMTCKHPDYVYAAPMNQSTRQPVKKVLNEVVNPFNNW